MRSTGLWPRLLLVAATLSAQNPGAPAMRVAGVVANRSAPWSNAQWIAAPWSTERDGAEADGSRPMPIFRRTFAVQGKVRQSSLRLAGLGQYEAWLDGLPLVKPGLHQAWTDYRKTVTYEQDNDLPELAPGPHVLTVMLGNGMYNVQHTKGRYTKFEGSFGAPRLAAELRLTYRDGRAQTVASDAQWKVSRGPVVFSSTYGGEDFDARRQPDGWQVAAFDDHGWDNATLVGGPGGLLRPAIAPDVQVVEAGIAPVHTADVGGGRTVYDFGRNFAGWPRIDLSAPTGAVLRLVPGELLNPDGTVTQRSSGGPMWWTYTARGLGRERWRPQFGYYGFRYMQVQWICNGAPCPSEPEDGRALRSIVADRLSTTSEPVGTFSSSNEMLNRIHALITAAMHNNEVSLFTDCPHREKLGWLEETHLVGIGLMFNNDLEGLYRATEQNIADAQDSAGMVPTIAPQYTKFGPKYAIYDDSPEWGSAAILAPWDAYRFYGNRTQLEHDYPVMQAYLRYLQSRAVDGIVRYGLGDWYDIGPGGPGFEKNTTLGVTGTLMLLEDAEDMTRIAVLLGHGADAQAYGTLHTRTAQAFNRRFWDAAHGWYDTGSQTANAMPLALGIVPATRREQVLAHLVADIHAHQDHVTTGEVGYPYLLRALMDAGRDDVILAMMLRKDSPSYGSQLAAGATALTEAWDANPASSQDHFMLGAAEEWFYRGLGGIEVNLAESEPIRVHPRVVDSVDWVRCGFRSRLGQIESDWGRQGNTIVLHVTVPRTATVELPLQLADHVRGAMQIGPHTYRVAAGTWEFHLRAPVALPGR